MSPVVVAESDPLTEHNQSTGPGRAKCRELANSLEKEKNTMSQKAAEEAVRNLIDRHQ
jgi:hypothetical protein